MLRNEDVAIVSVHNLIIKNIQITFFKNMQVLNRYCQTQKCYFLFPECKMLINTKKELKKV